MLLSGRGLVPFVESASQQAQGCCKVGNHMRESGFAKGGKPFDWGFGGCAPDFSLFPAAEGGKKRLCNSPVSRIWFLLAQMSRR